MVEQPTSRADSALAAKTTPRDSAVTSAEIIAAILSVIWLIAAGGFFLSLPRPEPGAAADGSASLRFVMTMLAIFLPVAMIWVATVAMRASRVVREESRRLQASIDAMRQTYLADRQNNVRLQPAAPQPRNGAAEPESAPATFASARDRETGRLTGPAPTAEDQPALALGTSSEDIAPTLSAEDLIRALNFPDTPDDAKGFAALRRALKHRSSSQVVQASQDVLTLLSQDGIYMDDLNPDRARPEIWRRFARGERGRVVAGLGGIRDRSSLALAAGRMRSDTIFRDAAHHFLRKFDQLLASFEETASDAEIAALSETRTARAFMLLGRVTGAFD